MKRFQIVQKPIATATGDPSRGIVRPAPDEAGLEESKAMQHTKAIYARAKLESRFWRKRLELSDSPFIRDIEAAGHRLGAHCRAGASDAMRAYIWRKQCALVRHIKARDSWRQIVNYGRELPLSMLRDN